MTLMKKHDLMNRVALTLTLRKERGSTKCISAISIFVLLYIVYM